MPSFLDSIIKILPEVKGPQQKKLPFKEKLKWTFIILLAFYILSAIPLYGLGENALIRFQQLSTILGASFGSIMSLGIGPIVTASIVLQLLVGSGILKYDMASHEGKAKFQGLQNLLSIVFVLFEATIYVIMGGLSPQEGLSPLILIFQLILGGLLVIYMDGVINKWGFGSGISLFIVAGVASQLMIRIFSPLSQSGVWAFGSGQPPVGALLVMVTSLINQDPRGALLAFAGIAATVIIFIFAVYSQAMKVEIPLSFGGIRSIRGHGIRWPLKFIYTSNIPVILIAALLANIQLWARLLENAGKPLLGTFSGNTPSTGIIAWLFPPDLVGSFIRGSFVSIDLAHAFVYSLFLIAGSVVFSIFWVNTAGMDAKSQAKQMMASGLQIPGFRRDERVLERLLNRYIKPLTIMGAIAIGFLAATADVIGALTNGTSILLSVMIIYRLYEDIAQQHMVDMHPALRKMMGE
ncbi:preprotein translocase subunit SecY [Candidatus Woesearchaeota archaeon]|nr:preprotein translocase subunit SecY [Candidatus Woesearchaeota archaeon]